MIEEIIEKSNHARNFSINPTMAEQTAEKAVKRVNAERLAAKRGSNKRNCA